MGGGSSESYCNLSTCAGDCYGAYCVLPSDSSWLLLGLWTGWFQAVLTYVHWCLDPVCLVGNAMLIAAFAQDAAWRRSPQMYYLFNTACNTASIVAYLAINILRSCHVSAGFVVEQTFGIVASWEVLVGRTQGLSYHNLLTLAELGRSHALVTNGLLCAERSLVVALPLRSARIVTVRRSCLVLYGSFACNTVLALVPYFFWCGSFFCPILANFVLSTWLGALNGAYMFFTDLYRSTYDSVVANLIPLVLVTVSTVVLIRQLQVARHERRAMIMPSGSGASKSSERSRETQTDLLVALIALCTTIFLFPTVVGNIVSAVLVSVLNSSSSLSPFANMCAVIAAYWTMSLYHLPRYLDTFIFLVVMREQRVRIISWLRVGRRDLDQKQSLTR